MVAGGRELIDTLWNVNFLGSISQIREFYELIDTLWNVNKDAKKVILEYSGINRYIMECK